MVSILWVAAALFGGMIIGFFLAALLAANDDPNDREWEDDADI